MPVDSKCCSSCYHLAAISTRKLCCVPRGKELGKNYGVGSWVNRKPTHDFPIPFNKSFALSADVWPEFQCQIIARTQTRPPLGGRGLRWTHGVKNGIPIEMSSPHSFLFDFYMPYRPILPRLATIHNAANRQTTERAIGIGRLCYSIGSLKMIPSLVRCQEGVFPD